MVHQAYSRSKDKWRSAFRNYSSAELNSLLATVGDVDDPELVLSYLTTLAQTDISIDMVNQNASMEKEWIYLKESGAVIDSPVLGENTAKFKLFFSGYKKHDTEEKIYISLVRGKLGFEGSYVGTLNTILDNAKERYEKISLRKIALEKGVLISDAEDNSNTSSSTLIVSNNVKAKKEELHTKIYDMLLKKEKFGDFKDGNKSRILGYIDIIAERVKHGIINDYVCGYILNSKKDRIVFNTGLLDKYMNDIFIMGDVKHYFPRKEVRLENFELCNGKIDLVETGFEVSEIRDMPMPVKMYNQIEELNFTGTIDDFDLINRWRIGHILIDRIERLPIELRDKNEDYLYGKIVKAIETGIKMQNHGYRYIVPMYNVERHEIQYLIPLHFNTGIGDIPELVLIIGKDRGFYNLMTVIDVEEAYDNARVLGYPNCLWMQ